MAFPSTYPPGSLLTIASYLRGQDVDRWVALEAAYDLLGYAGWLGKNGFKSIVGADIVGADNQSLATQCEQLATVTGSDTAPTQALPPWLLQLLLKIIQELFSKP